MTNRTLILAPIFVLVGIGLFYRVLLESYGLTITSQWRSPANNKAAEGKPLSLHLIGLAWDVRTKGVLGLNEKVRNFSQWLPWGKYVPEPDHLHIQFL